MARVTGLEPATSGVTGRHSNQLSYTRAFPYRERQAASRGRRLGAGGGTVKQVEAIKSAQNHRCKGLALGRRTA
jgi:hypothetical protein